MSSEFDRQNLISIFVLEASDGLDALTKALHPPDGRVPGPQELTDQYITAHRICGAAALYGFSGVAQLAEHLETLLEQVTPTPMAHWDHAVDSMRNITHSLHGIVRVIGQGGVEDVEAVARCWASITQREKGITCGPAPIFSESIADETYVLPELDAEILSYFIPEAGEYLDTIDRLILTLRAKPDADDSIHRLFRAAHTLKGSAYTVGYQVIGDVARPMEDCLVEVHENRLPLSPDILDSLAKAAELIRLILRHEPASLPKLQHDLPLLLNRFTRMSAGTAAPSPPTTLSDDTRAPSSHSVQNDPIVTMEEPTAGLSARYVIPDLDPEILSYFIPEAQEYLELLEANLLRLDKDPYNRELIDHLFRSAHTLKGSAYTVGFRSIGDLVHHVEDFMGAVRDGRLHVMPGHTDLILRAIDVVRVLMRRDLTKVDDTRHRFDAARTELRRLDQENTNETAAARPSDDSAGPATARQSGRDESPRDDEGVPNEKSADEREVIRVSYVRLERLMNLVGELVIGRGRLEQRLRVLEQLSQQVLTFKSRLVDSIRSFSDKHTFTYQEVPSVSTTLAGQGLPAFGDFGNLELDKYDDFNVLARRIGEVTADITESMSQLDGSIQKAHDEMSQLQQLTLVMRDEIAHARMVPIGTAFTRFRRAVRETARASNKEVSLVTSGEQTEVDTGIVERLADPLVHLVRNAVYHGIEPVADRIAKGKPALGTVYLHAAHRGNSVIIEVEDDGAGLDLGKIRAKAGKMGSAQLRQIQAMSDRDVRQLIFMPGFSTADKVGDQAGRGVGLDVVKRVVEGMNGHIEVESEPGRGTKFTLNLPLTLLIATALLVRVGTEKYAIPLLSIQEVTVPTPSSVREEGHRTLLQINEHIIELHSLHHILRREPGRVDWTMPVVIVRTAGAPVGLAVDEVLGRQEIVIKPLGPLKVLEHSCFGGATIDPEGRVVLVVDPNRLMPRELKESVAQTLLFKATSLQEESAPQEPPSNKPEEARLLLIDDSLSIRKFVGRMLEEAGYPFDTAVDGEDGLRKASTTKYRMILTDLEMPKLNGFEVIQALRSRPETRQTPVVVMTTRARDKHRQMAINLGANSYIAKPVEERMLLQEVARWLGKASTLRR
ncbi:hybrid sensor histidine kinase/response regulator [Candidatus Nitrospira nitrificans]|uniref:Chemotaxis protein CheA n=1 Tax=Candidatus Nitrospira nitrificans TaxID=1742973 RepID=A0A0S4LQR6_9BACT|nr:Hpt domain-containing protein [Candidatus Nitrospira nitrificans]CUS39018.1 putative Chemotaxis protein CheA modulated with response regulator receiver region (Modular protein) [Candidatus Nitrospira nitrificans]